jgi:hypothetical protein
MERRRPGVIGCAEERMTKGMKMPMRRQAIARSLGAALVLYVAYFAVGVVLEVLVYASAAARDTLPSVIPWKAFFDAAQVLIAVALLRLFFRSYDPRIVLAAFAAFLVATLLTIYNTAAMAMSTSSGVAQFLVAILICVLLLWKQRL